MGCSKICFIDFLLNFGNIFNHLLVLITSQIRLSKTELEKKVMN